jgi:hypothetical protein
MVSFHEKLGCAAAGVDAGDAEAVVLGRAVELADVDLPEVVGDAEAVHRSIVGPIGKRYCRAVPLAAGE